LPAARWFHAIIQSIGIALVAWLAWRIFQPVWGAILATAALADLFDSQYTFGQFGEVYAIYFTAGVIQYLAYWLVVRGPVYPGAATWSLSLSLYVLVPWSVISRY